MRLLLLALLVAVVGCGDDKEKAARYGLEERVYNSACIVETLSGDVITVAPTLSATGCYQNLASKTPVAGMIAFDINVALWTDGAHKRRYFGIPPDTTIGFTKSGPWQFPVGTVFMKEFLLDRVVGDASSRFIMETRFLVRGETAWRGYSYRWNEDGTDGTLLIAGETGSYEVVEAGVPRQHLHTFPSRTQCVRCHPVAIGGAIGLQTPQMNRTVAYGDVSDNQLRALNHVGFFDRDIEKELGSFSVLPSPEDTSLPLETRARAILHANCSHCHQPQGSAVSAQTRDLRFDTPLADTFACEQITAGESESSELWQRIEAIDMPPIATELLDPRLDLVRQWIDEMTSCP